MALKDTRLEAVEIRKAFKVTAPASPIFDARIEAVLSRLHTQSRRELPSLTGYFVLRSLPQWLKGGR